ncbi:MAG: fused MFS/spermidine synthase [Magnetococcales bacterium]|nr:fused MFS/spermidine synthase [Magnetococcales bacterium]
MQTLYHKQHRDGLVEVVEDGEHRTLSFDSHLVQSRMFLADPIALALNYTRCMMAGLLLGEAKGRDTPLRVLMIGLGGGSMAKFLLRHFPACRMDVVERDPDIPPLTREYFHLPDSDRLTLFLEDGASFLDRRAASGYDLILVDAYDREGMSSSVYAMRFFAALEAHLTSRGVVAVNFVRGEANLFRRCTEFLLERFAGRVLSLPVPGSSNEIGFAGPGVEAWEDRREIDARAWELEDWLGLDFAMFVREMRLMELPAGPWRWLGLR